jgi:glucose-6-phosphate 1-epimerase
MANQNPQTGRVTFLDGRGELPMLEIATPWSSAEIYLHGAHVTHFQIKDEQPLLFMSQCSRFEREAPIRGGIPIIFPWFGKPADKPGQHGFARVRNWELKEIHSPADGSVSVRLRMGNGPQEFQPCSVECLVTVNQFLTVELVVANESDHEMVFENCLHSYFTVGDIAKVTVAGLKGAEYLNQPTAYSRHKDTDEVIRIAAEVDRAYLSTTSAVEIHDASLGRVIRVEKAGSNSTVVWNPWIAKAKAMQDFGDDEYQRMICVESGNVAENALKLAPGETSRLKVKLSSGPLK